MTKKWNSEDIASLVASNDVASMRAVVAIWRRQTQSEKNSHSTHHLNSVGFSQAHARAGTAMARWMMKYQDDGIMRQPVSGWVMIGGRKMADGKRKGGRWEKKVDVCRSIAIHYREQLAQIANGE